MNSLIDYEVSRRERCISLSPPFVFNHDLTSCDTSSSNNEVRDESAKDSPVGDLPPMGNSASRSALPRGFIISRCFFSVRYVRAPKMNTVKRIEEHVIAFRAGLNFDPCLVTALYIGILSTRASET